MTQLLQNALYGTALILAAALLRRVLKDRLLPEARLCLWAVCLFRLLTPAAPASVLSLWGLFQKPAPAPVQTPQLYIPAPSPDGLAAQPASPGISWGVVLCAVWLAVGLALAARYAVNWRRTRRAVASAIPLGRDDPRYFPLPKCARLREGPMEGAPLTFGAVRPTVVLSPGLEGEELACVLAHEGVHARRRDNLWHYATALALAVHWWNPAVWLMARLLRRDIELACDRAALKKLGADKRADYARALVSLSTQEKGPAFCQTFGRKAAEERILSVMKFKKTSIIGVIFSLALVLAVSAAFASEPKEPDEYNSVKTGSSQTVTVPLPDKTREIQSGFPEVDPDDVDLSLLEERLDKKVADDQLTREEADLQLANTQAMLDQARRGELKLFLYDSGDGESWVYGAGVFQVNGEMQSRFVDPGRVLQPLYRDEDGKLVPIDPDTVMPGYVLGDPSQPDLPTYVEEGEFLEDDGVLGRLSSYDVKLPTFDEDGNPVGDGITGSRFYSYNVVTDNSAVSGGAVRTSSGLYGLCKDKACKISYDHCHIDGKTVRVYQENPGLLCAHDGCDNDKPHEHDGVKYAGKAPEAYVILDPEMDPAPSGGPIITERGEPGESPPMQLVTLEEYKALLDQLVKDGKMTQADANSMYAGAKQGLERGNETSGLYTSPDGLGSYAIMTLPLCDLPECTNRYAHSHDGASYVGHCPIPCTQPGCNNFGLHGHDGVLYDGTCRTSDDLPQPVPSAVPVGHHGNGHH